MATSGSASHLLTVFNQKVQFVACISALLAVNGIFAAAQTDQLPDAPVPQLVAQASPPDPPPQAPPATSATITIPAGTRLQLVLTHPVDSHATSHGDAIFAQTTAPVLVGDQVAIPGGTYLQGKVEKLTRNGTRAEMLMQSVSLVFPNGYVAQAGGPVNIESEEWTAWNNPQGRTKAAIVLAPILGVGLGFGIGAASDHPHTITAPAFTPPPGFPPVPPLPPITANTHTGLMIGGIVGSAAGGIAALILAARNRQFYIEEGSPLAMSLPQAITLTQSQVDAANQKAATQPPPPAVRRPQPSVIVSNTTDHDTCYTPGSPGTPGTHIPGTPGVNGSPGTPDVDIPGTPPTAAMPYPCP